MGGATVTEWPFFVWKFKHFGLLTQEMKTNCSVQGLEFNMIFEQVSTASSTEDHFKLHVEEIPTSTEMVKVICFQVRSYIIDRSGQKCFPKTTEVTFSGQRKFHYVWGGRREPIMKNYKELQQGNGETWFINVFEPKIELDLCHPKSTLDKSPWISLEALSKDFGALRNTQADFVLMCGNQQFGLHRHVLQARCAKLAKRLEETGPKVLFSELDSTSFEYLIKYIYTGCLPDITSTAAQELYMFGSKYELKDLMKLCATIMTTYLTEMNVYDMLLLAHKHKDEEFKEGITDYILSENMLQSDNWISFTDTNMELALQVYWAHAQKE